MNQQLTIQLLGLIGTIFISLQVLLGRKWSTKFRGFWAGRITESTRRGKKLRRKVYQFFYWTWPQIFAIIGLLILVIALILTYSLSMVL